MVWCDVCCAKKTGSGRRAPNTPLLTDTVEKVFFDWRKKFLSLAGASEAPRRGGPYQFTQKRSVTFGYALRRLEAAEKSKN